jgi:hypothetical protein
MGSDFTLVDLSPHRMEATIPSNFPVEFEAYGIQLAVLLEGYVHTRGPSRTATSHLPISSSRPDNVVVAQSSLAVTKLTPTE